MRTKLSYIGALLFIVALLAWTAVGLFVRTITADERDHAFNMQNAEEMGSKEASTVRLHALAQETASKRAELDATLSSDIVSIVDMIEAVGEASGVKVALSSAIPENTAVSEARGGPPVKAVGLVINAQGKFSSLMHAIALFETLPVPSTIVRFNLERSSGSLETADAWRMNVHIRILTTSDISS